jgi:ABC-type dipeptide/oligopeptide/nickel transport system permease component
MGRFLLQRLPALLPVLLLVLVIVFALARLIPGDPAVTLLGPGATSQQIEAPWAALAPGGAILLAVLAFNLIGDALADWFNPRRRKAG